MSTLNNLDPKVEASLILAAKDIALAYVNNNKKTKDIYQHPKFIDFSDEISKLITTIYQDIVKRLTDNQ